MGLLAMAGVISGAGNAGARAVENAQMGSIYSMLNRDREEMETNRQQLINQFQTERDTTAFARQKELNAATQQAEREREQERAGLDLTKQTLANQQAEKQHSETLAATKAHYSATEAHYKQLESLAKAQHADAQDVITHFVTDDKGAFFGVKKSGAVVPITNPVTKEPIVGPKGLSEASKALGSYYGDRVKELDKRIGDPLITPEERRNLETQRDQLDQRVRGLYGEKLPKPAERKPFIDPLSINDRFDTTTAPVPPYAGGPLAPPALAAPSGLIATAQQPVTENEAAARLAQQHQDLVPNEKPSLGSRAVRAVVEETKRQLAPSTTKPTMTNSDVHDFIKFSKDPAFVASFKQRFGALPTQADYDRLKDANASSPDGLIDRATREPGVSEAEQDQLATDSREAASHELGTLQKLAPSSSGVNQRINSLTNGLRLADKRRILDLAQRVKGATDQTRAAAEDELRNFLLQTMAPMYSKIKQPPKVLIQDVNDFMETLLKGRL